MKNFFVKEGWYFLLIIFWGYATYKGEIPVGEVFIIGLLLCILETLRNGFKK